MRCKRHTVDLTSTVGVCASCLHERLLSLAASIAIEDNNLNNNNNHRLSRKSSNPPPPLPSSDAGRGDLGVSGKDFESNLLEKPKGGKVSRIHNPFRARSDSNESSSSSSSRSWISSFLSTGRSKKQQPTTIEDVISGCRGMSPARDTGGEDNSEIPSGSIEETPGRPRRTTPAMKTPGRRKIMTGMGLCLSPLVRARPNCPFKRKSRFPSEFVGNAGEVTAGEKPHISEAASFCANRSKKLADLASRWSNQQRRRTLGCRGGLKAGANYRPRRILEFESTIGVELATKTLKAQIWDTAGQERHFQGREKLCSVDANKLDTRHTPLKGCILSCSLKMF